MHQLRVVAKPVLAHEGGEPAALDVLGRRPPRDLTAELEARPYMQLYTHNREMPDYEPAVILSACRTPIGSFGGVFKDLSAADLGAVVIREAIRRAGVDGGDLGDVIMGCVLQAGAGMNVARQAAIKAGVPVAVPGETINRVCGSGLQAVVHAVEAIRVGIRRSRAGWRNRVDVERAVPAARARDGAIAWATRNVVDSMLAEGLTCAIKGCHMGITAETIVERYGISRADQDAFAAESQRRAQQAIESGAFKDEIVAGSASPQRKGDPLYASTRTNIRARERPQRSWRR